MADNNKSSERPFLDNSDFTYRLQDIASRYWPAALAATLGSGLIGGGLAWKTKPLNETPAQRRKRILKAALLPMLGVGAGSAALMGAGAALNMTSLGHNLNTPEGRKARQQEIDSARSTLNTWEGLNTIGEGAGLFIGGAVGKGVADAVGKVRTSGRSGKTPFPYTKPIKDRLSKSRAGKKLAPFLPIAQWLWGQKNHAAGGVGAYLGYKGTSALRPDRSAEFKELDRQEAELRNMQ